MVENMARYILNAPVLTAFGSYEFESISLEEAQEWIQLGPFTSAVGHQGTADILTELLMVPIPSNRITIEMAPHDEALVFRLLRRQAEGEVLTKEQLEHIPHELGILRRTA